MEPREKGERISKYFFLIITLMIGILAILSIFDFFTGIGASSMNITESHRLLDKILYTIILIELLHLTITYTIEVVIHPRELILIILTAVGREIIVKDLFKEPPVNTFAAAFVLIICIYALKTLPATQVKIE